MYHAIHYLSIAYRELGLASLVLPIVIDLTRALIIWLRGQATAMPSMTTVAVDVR